jgi:hypothetical protein
MVLLTGFLFVTTIVARVASKLINSASFKPVRPVRVGFRARVTQNLKGMHVETVHLSRETVFYSFYRRVPLVNWLLFSPAKLSRSKGHE